MEYLATPQASTKVIDFTDVDDVFLHRIPSNTNHEAVRPRTRNGLLLTPERVNDRARRRAKKAKLMTDEEFDYISPKPVEDWDLEELARGRPRNVLGTFAGRAPSHISRAVHEAAMDRFKSLVRTEMNIHTVGALEVINHVITDMDVDDKGRPVVAPSTKLEAAKWLVEHVLGKPTQRVENDISVKLQGILGTVMVNPDSAGVGGYAPAHLPGVTMPLGEGPDVIDSDADYEDEDL